jgi:hypothetical protein
VHLFPLRAEKERRDRSAVAKEVLAARRRAAFDKAVNGVLRNEKLTAASIGEHLVAYHQKCKELEGNTLA